MEAELKELGFHGDARDAQPTSSFSLIALGEVDGAGEDFAFGAFKDASVNVGNFTTAGCGEEFVDMITKGNRGR